MAVQKFLPGFEGLKPEFEISDAELLGLVLQACLKTRVVNEKARPTIGDCNPYTLVTLRALGFNRKAHEHIFGQLLILVDLGFVECRVISGVHRFRPVAKTAKRQ